jgi:aconitase A
LFIVNAETIANMGDVISTDKLSPWNNKEKGVRSKQYYIHYEVEVEANCVKKYTRTDSKRDPFKTYCFEYQTSHHEFPVSKKVRFLKI